ncbi:MAG: cytochrome c maturation protein CcmE [Nannocystaceae bacterium]|nr:cytochrome c maturation protein CcmE [Nannocystaceae bacterium]
MTRAAIAVVAVLAAALACREPTAPAADGKAAAELAEAIAKSVPPPSPGVLEYLEADELGAAHRGQRVRVHGVVTTDPILGKPGGGGYRFVMAKGDARVTVEYHGVLPDRFQAKLEVVVTGTLSADGSTLASDDLVAKCPETYESGATPR